jgi:hypothetical protein
MGDPQEIQASDASGPEGLRRRITRTLKRARKTAGPSFDENHEMVQFQLEEARILAILELADAIRSGQGAVDA